MSIRRASLGGASLLPVGGPAGLPGQRGADGKDSPLQSINGFTGANPGLGDIGAAPFRSFGLTRAQVATRAMLVGSFRVDGYAAVGDYGAGATFVAGNSWGPMATQDAAGVWYQLDLGAPDMYAGWFGIAPGIDPDPVKAAAQGQINRAGLKAARPYLTTGRTLWTPAGKVALAPDPANLTAPAWELGDGTATSIATTANWSVRPAGGCSTPGAGELGGPGGTEFVAVGTWGDAPMFRLNGPIPGVVVDVSFDCAGLAKTGPDIVHAFRSKLYLTTQRYAGTFGAILRTIDGPRFIGLTQGFMECEGEIVCTQPANPNAEGVYLKACESPLPSTDPAYYYQGFSRNRLRIKAEIPGGAGKGGIVVDRIDNNGLPMCFPFIGGTPLQAGAGGVRGIVSNDGFFPCENDFSGGHIIGGFIGQWGSGGNFAVPYSTSDGEPLPALGSGFQFWTYTGLMGFLRRIYCDRSGTLASPPYTFAAWQGSGLSVDDATGAVRLGAVGVLGLQCDSGGRAGLGMAPLPGYRASVAGDLCLASGSGTFSAAGPYVQIQGQSTVYLTTDAIQRVTVNSFGLTVAGAGSFTGPVGVGRYTVATLPTAGIAGRLAYATNGCALQSGGALENVGAGTGVLVVDSGSVWRVAGTNITVRA